MDGSLRQTFTVGNRRVLGVSDGTFTMREGFMNVPGFQHRYEGDDGVARLPIASFVVDGERTLLIDAGIGPATSSVLSGGALIGELAAAGIRPEQVDVVAVSHLHLDHDGWLATTESEPVFPNAVVHIGAGDYEHFVLGDDSAMPRTLRMAPHLKALLRDLLDRGRLELLDDTTEIVPGVVALPTPGHTPGHLCFAIRDGGEQLMVLGDAMYCPAQLTDMDLAAMHDVDPVLARRSRELIAREVERHHADAVGCHFPGLRAARLVGGSVVEA